MCDVCIFKLDLFREKRISLLLFWSDIAVLRKPSRIYGVCVSEMIITEGSVSFTSELLNIII